ncbi:mediator of RNA polymerase II transcription subunit 33A-like isoform X1 [Phragmites australis]|uniref:mediator of RNA polymerase II transcription subunit 33A-like isoform X1 n=1 Tax=Phragmites australis TaxID=29695 RepID=UPI002D7786CD|nr:mediator of RNA polymerase II transcription subunit 33A-like isoform X1 [Phragmites australis]
MEMEMATAPSSSAWVKWAAEYTKAAQAQARPPPEWAARVAAASEAGESGDVPWSAGLAEVLARALLSGDGGAPAAAAWKYADAALSARLASPALLIVLLSTRVIPHRFSRPTAYRLYLELLRRHGFNFRYQMKASNFTKIMDLIDENLGLSKIFGFSKCQPGVFVVHFVLCILWQLVDAVLDDEGLLALTPEKKAQWPTRPEDVSTFEGSVTEQRTEKIEKLQKMNSVITIELIEHLLRDKVITRILSLARENMQSHWGAFTNRLHLLVTNSSTLQNSVISLEPFQQLILGDCNVYGESKHNMRKRFHPIVASNPHSSPIGRCLGASYSALWIPIDMYLEDCLDGSIAATNSIEILSGLVKALQAVNRSTWHDAFLALWVASLRLVQREREPIEGPVPHLDTRLCMLLSITTLAVADIVEEADSLCNETELNSHVKEKKAIGNLRKELMLSLQTLGDYESLLVPPPFIIPAANQAATKAAMFISGINISNGYMENVNGRNYSGNMQHLIVESCISRNLLDTSAYYWPGYINGHADSISHTLPSQLAGWSSFMNGAPLTQSLVNMLVSTPASSLAELKKLFEVAVNGSDEDKVSAATVLCGATLLRGWNFQEHTVRLVVKLLSPSDPVDCSGRESQLIKLAPMLNVILTGISPVDYAPIFSFHGLIPELAAALMAICEVFGCLSPSVSWTLRTGEELSAHTVFSNAFILLLRLWKFNHPPLEYCIMGDGAPVGSQLTPEYLLLLRNSQVLSPSSSAKHRNGQKQLQVTSNPSSEHPIFMDSFPKLKLWYRQHQACLASTLSGLAHGTPVHNNVDSLLNLMFVKASKGGTSIGSLSGSSSISNSSGPGADDLHLWPQLPAWEILEAVPFVVDAALTACAHGRLFPRELATGLKDLADFLPASLATIVSYFSAEVTRGVWKPASMNGTDWPSPAANLSMVEEHIKKIVAATGVDVPRLVTGGSSLATLPLPLAAFVSLTITYKLDKASERFLNLAGPALENLAASCPWPSMAIVAALWTQKVKRWSDFLVFSASRTVFHHNNDAVVQLLRSCFTATLGMTSTSVCSCGGVASLLGHGFGSHCSGGLSPVAPGILYLRIFRCIKDCSILTEDILSLLMLSVKDIAETTMPRQRSDKLKNIKYGMRHGQVSLAAAMTQVKVAASLGATLVWLSGGTALVQSLMQEMLPSWFLSVQNLDQGGASVGIVYKLGGHALAYFAVYSGMFAWGIDPTPVSRRRERVMRSHFEFLASALDRKISLGCDLSLWRAYVSGFVGLVVECTPCWAQEVDLKVLRRLSSGLRQWNEDELAVALLRRAGPEAMGTAAELILGSEW